MQASCSGKSHPELIGEWAANSLLAFFDGLM